MSLLSRPSLSSIVCPSAPFLAPRFLCAPARVAALRSACWSSHARLQRPTYATRATKKPKEKLYRGMRRPLKPDILQDDVFASACPSMGPLTDTKQLPLLEKFQKACATCNLSTMMDLYPTIIASPLMRREDTRRAAQALHTYFRTSTRAQTLDRIVRPFLERLTADIRNRKLPPHPAAHVHLLGVYKEGKMYEEGNNFWQWLAAQDDSYVDQAVYGAAIELLAYRGIDDLEDLEDLYADGLKRFPGTFAEYHLSSEAVVPDRTQATTVAGLPIALLQGITTARTLNRDWKNAYLALDTALRLYPTTVPSRFFELFMTERPLTEAYTAFLLACRSGVLLKPNHLTTLLQHLKKAAAKLPSLKERTTIVQGMANAMYAYVQSGGSVEGPHTGIFLNTFQLLLPHHHHGAAITEDEMRIRNSIVDSAYEMVSLLIQAGLAPYPQLFVSLAQLAGRFGIPSLLTTVEQDMETTNVDIGDVGRRGMLYVAGELRDKSLIEVYWSRIFERAESLGQQISETDWITLARVCRRADHKAYLHQQLESLRHTIDTNTEEKVMVELDDEDRVPRVTEYSLLDPEAFVSEIDKTKRILQNVAAVIMAGQPLDMHKTPFSMFLDPARENVTSKEDDLRSVYDELSTDPHQPQPAPGSQKETPVSSTGIPFGELRFLNWATIVGLMKEAEATETEFQRRLDNAIAHGVPFDKRRPFTPIFRKPEDSVPDEAPQVNTPLQIHSLRKMVKRLRSPYASNNGPQRTLPSSFAR